jgi:hypothetical protein
MSTTFPARTPHQRLLDPCRLTLAVRILPDPTQMPRPHHLPLLVMLLGAVGILICLAGIAAVWLLGARLDRTTDLVFAGIGKSLVAVQERAVAAQQHAAQMTITAQDVAQALRERTADKIGDKAAEFAAVRFDIEQKAERLEDGLQQADLWLEIAVQSIHSVDRSLEALQSLGAPLTGELVAALLEKLTALRNRLGEASAVVADLRTNAADLAAGPTLAERRQRLAQFAARLLVTLGEVDTHLAELTTRLADLETNADNLQARTHTKIALAKYALLALLAWLALGQVSLCEHARHP